MSIRQILLIAFLSFSAVAATVMTLSAYTRSRAALRDEIRENLRAQAATLMEQVDAALFERVENVHGWSRLDLMQEVRVGDVDKRLARFLRDLKSAYAGLYTDLFCAYKGRIIAASDAGLIGRPWTAPTPWLRVPIQGAVVDLDRPESDGSHTVLTLHAPLHDAFSGGALGQLYARFNWDEVRRLLDHAVGRSGREALLLDADGNIIAASTGVPDAPQGTLSFPAWGAEGQQRGTFTANGRRLGLDTVLVGYARSAGYKGLPGFGWRMLVVAPTREAFAPVQGLLYTLLALLLTIVAIAGVLATRLSGRIARPIQRLTGFTRRIQGELDRPPPALEGRGEVAELTRAFQRMFEDLKRSREHLVRASKLAAVGEMSAMLAHEVRNPLGILRSSAQLLKRQPGLDERGHEMLGYMINECDRINTLVSNLLESARPHAPVFAPADLDELVHRVINLLRGKAEKNGVVLCYEPPQQDCVLECDGEQLVQVILNLVLNAIQILPAGGHIWIRCGGDENDAWFEVADDGPGIPPALRGRIPEPFLTGRPGGMGLGLTVVQEIVRLHGGTLEIGEAEAGGARFRVSMARARAQENDG